LANREERIRPRQSPREVESDRPSAVEGATGATRRFFAGPVARRASTRQSVNEPREAYSVMEYCSRSSRHGRAPVIQGDHGRCWWLADTPGTDSRIMFNRRSSMITAPKPIDAPSRDAIRSRGLTHYALGKAA